MSESLSRSQVEKVARLSRLKLSDAEIDALTTQLGQVLGYIEMLNELDTENVEPMAHAVEVQNVFREDELTASLPREESLQNAPKTNGEYFLVPPILGDS